ncbi:MAG: FAD-binding oxidoreductase, partial [Burkholderiaceae bacterium]
MVLQGGAAGALRRGGLADRLRKEVRGDVLFDAASRGRYATDASIYQRMPLGVVVPETSLDLRLALEVARDAGVPVLSRGGGTSQCGQTVGEAVVIDTSRHLRKMLSLNLEAGEVTVEPGMVLDHLNQAL